MLHGTFDAPVESVYAAWTDPSVLARWFAPGEAVVLNAIADVAVGGRFLVEMRESDGRTSLVRGTYREVVHCRRISHTWRWEGSDVETLVTVEFEPASPGGTRLTLTHSGFPQDEDRDRHAGGWTACLANLNSFVARCRQTERTQPA